MNIDYSNGMKTAKLYICNCDIEEYNTNFYSLILFVKNQKGYHHLCKLSSISMTKGYIIKPRINHNILEQYKDGLICVSSGANSEIAIKLSDGNKAGAIEIAEYYNNLFGDDFYIELQNNTQLSELASELNIKTVGTADEIVNKCDFEIVDSIKVSNVINADLIKDIVNWANKHEIKTGKVCETAPNFSIEIDADRCEQVIDEYIIPRFGTNCVAKVETPDKNNISIIITTTPIDEIIPVKMSPEGDLTTLYSKETIEKMGLCTIAFF